MEIDMQYLIVYEKSETGYSAYVPDIDGVIAAGDTLEECKTLMHEALQSHIEWLREDGVSIPAPSGNTLTEFFEVAA
jgi:predicted RNase H-like HicB family nuclease